MGICNLETQLKALIDNTKWGNPKTYDITITRKGTTMNDTEYAVMPNPSTPLEEGIKEQFINSKIDLNALYEGKDPFQADK